MYIYIYDGGMSAEGKWVNNYHQDLGASPSIEIIVDGFLWPKNATIRYSRFSGRNRTCGFVVNAQQLDSVAQLVRALHRNPRAAGLIAAIQ
jgi:hypothetical protein